ncbi:protein shortage in chiasmata 1 ortholog [Syngnathoides biaculeatus]|uniref:protein shortage in chiasmata 1 ortholog n=1 Tax=Syngnathoides biaculeatus TaxID=300417 RepID=UPI002ADD90E2|nr:protein shortage in chiasmata 1 ortholog [Syngnathoides biaculeatus]
MFSLISFKALDYAFETRNRRKVLMDLLALPTPNIGDGVNLTEVTYTKPWVRGKALYTSLSTSVMDDLRGTTQHINSTEKYLDPWSMKDTMEIVESCPSDSFERLHQSKQLKLSYPCEESFFKLPEQIDPATKDKDLFLLEEIMAPDFLPQFRHHLPTLKSKVSRLKTLLVADPLINRSGDFVTEETILSYCAPFEWLKDGRHKADITEEFTKEPLMANESLLLPEVLDDCKITADYPSSFSSLCSCLNVVAEQLVEQLPDLEALNKDESASVDFSQLSSVSTTSKGNWMKDTHPSDWNTKHSEWTTLPTDMELEVTLTPPTTATSHYHACQSICDLRKEELSLLDTLSLVSAGAQKQMEASLWMVEKYPNYVLRFLFAEPEVIEATIDFQPLSEALKLTTLKSVLPETDTRPLLGNMRELPERLNTEAPSHEEAHMMEEFNLSPEPDGEYCLQSASPNLNECTIVADTVQKQTSAEFSHKTLPLDTKEVKLSTSTNDRKANKVFFQVPSITSTEKMTGNIKSQKNDDKRGVVTAARSHLVQHADPLTTFMMLRSQQASTAAPEEEQEKQRSPVVHPTPKQTGKADRKSTTPTITTVTLSISPAAVSGHAFRGQSTTATTAHDALSSRVVQVKAIDSQCQAYSELLSLACPRLSSAKELGLNLPAWSDFKHLTPDQTRYVLKQREMAMCRRTLAEKGDEERLFHHVFVIHMLVTARELLFKCHLSAAVEYLSKASETCFDTGLTQLLRRLHIILHLGRRNHECDVKLLELQKLVVARQHNDKILVITSLNCDNNMSTIMESLKQLIAVSVVRPDDDNSKLNGARVVSSIQDIGCVLVYGQHLGPDFPWNLFSLVVEYDHAGPSPWATVCKERRVQHLTFDTVLPGGGQHKMEHEDTLADKVGYVLLVTESLLNSTLLLQAMESMFNITLLVRSHCPSLQKLGVTNHYSVITVDETTAIVVQEQEELCEEKASEVIVMRLTALSLQYNNCWIILHCPDSKGGGFSGEAFSNLVVVYSSLVLFGMKPEDLDVKVLIASDVLEVARWVSRICFLNLMSSDRNPVNYLEREWLAVTSSQEEHHLCNFPCVNPLVAQLMLRRAPSLSWLLTASLTQLEEMLPEVPSKVLKLFSNTTSLYEAQPAQSVPAHLSPAQSLPALPVLPQSGPVQVGQVYPLASSPPPPPPLPELTNPSSEPFPSFNPSFLLAPESEDISFYSQEDATDFVYDDAWPAKSPDLSSRGLPSQWKDRNDQEVMLTGRRGRAGAAGRVVERGSGKWSRQDLGSLDATFRSLNLPSQGPLWRGSPAFRGSHLRGRMSTNYGSRYWMGQERKRSENVAGLTGTAVIPLKKSRLSYEKVPGQTDGQTRLKLF